MMGLTMGQRQAVTKANATRYKRASKPEKSAILDELCATTGWHRNHARKALGLALRPRIVRTRRPREPKYGADVVAALRFCWAVLGAPTGKRLAPVMGELVPTLRRFGELDVSDEVAAAVVAMSPATMDRRLAKARAAMTLRGRSHTKPGSLLKDSIAIRTWAQWDDVVPGFVEIDLVGHEGGNAIGEHAYTLTVTDIATGWTENRSVPNKAECVHHEGPWRGVDDLELATLNWVSWFNETRLHSSIGNVPPAEFESEYYRRIGFQQQPLPGELALH